MARSNRITVPIRDRKRQRLDVYAPAAPKAITPARPFGEAGPAAKRAPQYGEIFATFEHLGVALTTRPRPGAIDPAGDVENAWVTLSYPASAFPSQAEAIAFSGEMRARATDPAPVEYAYSHRRLPGQGMVLGANPITSGYNLVLTLKRRAEEGSEGRITDTYGIQHGAAWVDRQRSASEALADWAALEDLFTDEDDPRVHARWEAKRRELELRLLERFEPYSARVAQTDLTFRATRALPGLHAPSFIGYEQFHNWDAEDLVNYKSERIVAAQRVRSTPWLTRAPGATTRMRVQLVPRRHRIVFAFTAVYAVGIIFTSPVYVTEPILGTYADILPLDWAYVGAEDDARNQESMSRRIAASPAYQTAFLQAYGAQVFTPFFSKILVRLDDGQWAVREGDLQRGELAGILDVSNEGGSRDHYEITRETHVDKGGRRMNYGRLYTGVVNPYPESGISTWSNSTGYGQI